MEKVKITIIGAGVVGLAVAAELSKEYQDIVLLEKENSFGQGTSSRNSEIIHAGIYYPKNSLKAQLCVEGKMLLYEFCANYNLPHKKIGKLIVATNSDEINQLEELKAKANENGVDDLTWITKEKLKTLEPEVNGDLALYSPSTGIVDSHSLMKQLERLAKENGVLISYGSEATNITKTDANYEIEINKTEKIKSEIIINCAGLFSDKISAMVGLNNYHLHYCKGEYFAFRKPSFLKHLVYPVPEAEVKSLGIHSVIDLAGNLKFGPSAEYVNEINYKVNIHNRAMFAKAVKTLFPKIEEEELVPDQAGIRPKLQGPGESFKDFVIKEEKESGYPGFINLIGIESPGLTACLAIAKLVRKLMK